MFFRTRKKIARLERRIASQQALLERINSALNQTAGHSGPDLGAIIGGMLETQGKQFTSAGEFLRTINEIAMQRAGAAMGRRGGKVRAATAKRDRDGRMLPKAAQGDCPLCNDPMTANFSMAEWGAHQTHRGAPKRESRHTPDERDIETTSRREPEPQFPLPVVIPAGDIAPGAGGDLATGDIDHGDHIHKADGSVVSKADLSQRN